MKYKVVSANSPSGLNDRVTSLINDGWEIIGSHQVAVIHSQNRYSGSQHIDTKHETEYSQTMIKKD